MQSTIYISVTLYTNSNTTGDYDFAPYLRLQRNLCAYFGSEFFVIQPVTTAVDIDIYQSESIGKLIV